MKRCTKCGLEKPIAAFAKHRNHGDGFRSHCKACQSVDNKKYRRRGIAVPRNIPDTKICTACKVEKLAADFGPDLSHRDGLRSRCNECRAAQAKLSPSYNKRRFRNFVLGAEYDPNPRAALFTVYMSRREAPRRGLAWELSLDDALQLVLGACLYCGAPPEPRLNHTSGKTFLSNGIDRLDPAKGYIPGNCVSCCAKCNRLKGSMTFEQFKELISNLYFHICDARPYETGGRR